MEQEAMDERMLKTGTVPVASEVDRLPQVGNGERELSIALNKKSIFVRSSANIQLLQSKENRKSSPRKRMRKKSCGNYKQKWPCDDSTKYRR